MSRKMTLPNMPAPVANRGARSYGKLQEMDFDKMYKAMEKGHRVCKMSLLKKWDPAYKLLCLKLETRLLVMNKLEQGAVRNKPTVLDIRTIREVQTLEFKQSEIKIADKWRRDKEIQNFDAAKILVISHGTGFTLQYWILLFESVDTCRLWSKGVHNLMLDTRDRDSSCHTTRIDRFLSRHFDDLRSPINDTVARKHMKPFVQTSLQFKVQSKQLQETTEDQMDVKQFMKAAKQIIHVPTLFQSLFNEYSDDGVTVSFANFLRFLQQKQNEESAGNRQKVVDLLRRFLHQDQAFNHERIEPTLSVMEFCDFLFSRENSLWDPMNEKVIQDMSKPLSHYWIASSHNTYLTGDQLRSESSLDCYAQALLMGCRCIELDCWDGQKKPGSQEFQDIVIYHGYTMTSKLLLRDVLFTIKHYAFINSEYPVILSIEDNCSVPAQRLLASEVKEILGDYLLTQPVHRDETALPSPASIKKKIILKHKKLTVETADGKTPVAYDEFEDNDSIVNSKDCIKKGILYLKDMTIHDWKPHVFILFQDRLCFLMDSCTEDESQDTISMAGDDEKEEDALAGFGVRPEEQHVTEEWFHGRCERDQAASRLLQYKEKGNGLFMIRDSNLFIGDFSLSILHDGKVHHVRIRTKMVEREKKYYFMDNKVCDTLYELVSYYTRHYLTTPNFRMALTIACPQPQPHLNEPWFHTTADKSKAEELLNRRNEDGAFLIRMSSSDENVFVLSIRVDGEFWHYRLKRDGRLFVVNQTAFENLNQIVEYYSTREFVRGISLRYPVNENDLNGAADMDVGVVTPGNYFDIRELEKPVLARAIRPHHGQGEDEITFPIDAMITVLNKDGDLWRGRYGSTTGFFRATCVQEIIGEKHSNQSESNYNTIELVGTAIERTGEPDKPFALKIKTAYNGQEWMLAASAREDIEDWFNYLVDNTKTANDKFHQIRSKEKERKIAAELSNLVVYCQAVPFDPAHIENGSFYEMCSFVENKLDKLLEKSMNVCRFTGAALGLGQMLGLVQFNMKQLSRVYPNGSRITSTNYNPVPMWNSACHMVALNYQTGDRAMQVNQGKFMSNGQCGFILKPKYMIDTAFDPLQANRASSSAVRVCMKIIAGRHLSRKDKNKGICSPFVEIEVIGLQCDERTFKSRTIASNGLNPMWNETFTFDVQFPELAMLRFHVEDGDFVGPKTDPFIGQSVLSLDSVRCGYRSVPLKNSFSEELELSALLIDLQMFRIDNTTLIQSARTVLQADRLAAKYNRTLTGTKSSASVASAPMKIAPQIGSRDHGSMESGMESPTTCSPLLNEEVNRMSVVSMNMSMNGVSMDSQDSDHTASAPPSLPTTPSTPGTPSAKTKKKGILSKFFNR